MCVLCVLLAGATQVQAGVKTIAFAGDNDPRRRAEKI